MVDDDPIYDREVWHPWLLNHLAEIAEKCPDMCDLAAMEISTPELFRDLEQKTLEVEFLGRERASTIRRMRDQILGLIERAYWQLKGLTEAEMALDENGQVRAILLTPALFEKSPEQFDSCWAPLGEFWLPLEKDFRPPDGRPMFTESELAALRNRPAEELKQARLAKLQ